MKEIKRLEALLRGLEDLHLGLMILCLALPLAVLSHLSRPDYGLVWGLGTVISGELMMLVCRRVKRKPLRALLSLGIYGLSLALTAWDFHWVSYLLSGIPVLTSGLILARPKGKPVLTVPKLYHLLCPLMTYAMGRASGVVSLYTAGVLLAALMTLVFLLYSSQERLLRDIRQSTETEVSVTEMIRLNRRVILVYLLAGILILSLSPLLMRRRLSPSASPQHLQTISRTLETVPASHPPAEHTHINADSQETIDLDPAVDGMSYLIALVFSLAVVIAIVVAILNLRGIQGGSSKHSNPREQDNWSIERLVPEKTKAQRERPTGYEKKLRSRYEKLIRSRTPKDARLEPMTPTELEREAGLSGPGAERIHSLYAQVRYSGAPATREQYAAFKEAARELDPAKQ